MTQALHEKFQQIHNELATEFFERREHIEVIGIGLLSGHNVYLLGDPGTAKSLLVRKYAKRVTAANYWETLLDRQLPLEAIFGPVDLLALRNGDYHRKTNGKAPEAHFLFFDEVGKAGPAVLNPLLTLLNEGIYHNNSKPMDCNIRVAVGASNEELEPELAAMWDRWLLRMIVNSIQEPTNFASLITSGPKATQNPTTVTLTEVDAAREEVADITVPPGIADKVIELKTELQAEQVDPSDRRWRQAMDVVRAAAWLNGRPIVEDDDLAVLRHVLWDVVEQIPKVEKLVLKHSSEFAAAAIGLDRELDEVDAKLTAHKGRSLAERSGYGSEAQVILANVLSKVSDMGEKARRQGRSTTKLDEVEGRVRHLRKRVFIECMDVPADRAELIG